MVFSAAPPVESRFSRPARRAELRDRVRDLLRARHYSFPTEEANVYWIKRYMLYHHRRHPAEMGPAEIRAFLTALAVRHHVASSIQNQALAALLFLYRETLGRDPGSLAGIVRAKRPTRVPVVLAAIKFTSPSCKRACERRRGEPGSRNRLAPTR